MSCEDQDSHTSVNVHDEQESAERCCCCAGKARSQTQQNIPHGEKISSRLDETKKLKSILDVLDEYHKRVKKYKLKFGVPVDDDSHGPKKKCGGLEPEKIVWVCLHGCAVLIFLVRAVWLFTHVEKDTQSEKAPEREKGVIRLAFAALYLMLGIVGPICSHFATLGHSFFQLKTLADLLSELNESKRRTDRPGSVTLVASHCCRWRRIGAGISNTLVLFSPVRTMLGVVLSYEDQAHYFTGGLMDEKAHHDLTVAVSLIGVVGMMVFSSAEVNDQALLYSKGIVEGLVEAIENEDESSHYLDGLWSLHQCVDDRLVNVWSKSCSVGTIWVSRLCVLFLISICLASYSLYEPRRYFSLVLVTGAFLSSLLSILLIYFMCRITTLCQARRAGSPGSMSVINAVNNRMRKYVQKRAKEDGEEEKRAKEDGGALALTDGGKAEVYRKKAEGASKDAQHLAFQDYVMTTNMGIHIMGITMSFELVLKLFRYLLIYTPTAVILIGQRIHSQQ